MATFTKATEKETIPTVLAEDGRGDEVLQDAAVSVKRTNHLTPNQELAHLLRQLPQFLSGSEADLMRPAQREGRIMPL